MDKTKTYIFYTKRFKRKNLNAEQTQAVKKGIKGFEASGVSLEKSKRIRLQEISQELAKLSSSFENNVLDSTMAWIYTTSDSNELKGLPEANIQAAKEKASQRNLDDTYALGIDIPTYLAVMQQSDNRNLREMFYKAYCTKASKETDNTNFDNDDNIVKILKLRIEKSQLLGFENHAERSLFTKMAETPNQVLELLNGLLDKSKSQAHLELKTLKEFANTQGFTNEFESWDSAYFAEKLKKYKYDFTAEELREYFPLETVEKGLFQILTNIYGLEIKENTTSSKYIPEQQTYDFYRDGDFIGSIICDLFARDNKRGGAWMDGSRTSFTKSDGEIQYPVAYVNCNFPSTNC